jgi:hypothetical protein
LPKHPVPKIKRTSINIDIESGIVTMFGGEGWKTKLWQCSAANSPTSCLEQFSSSSGWQLAPLAPSVGGAADASSSG